MKLPPDVPLGWHGRERERERETERKPGTKKERKKEREREKEGETGIYIYIYKYYMCACARSLFFQMSCRSSCLPAYPLAYPSVDLCLSPSVSKLRPISTSISKSYTCAQLCGCHFGLRLRSSVATCLCKYDDFCTGQGVACQPVTHCEGAFNARSR